MNIDVKLIRESSIRLLDHVIDQGGLRHLELDCDMYWLVPESDMYRSDWGGKRNLNLEVGSLHAEYETLLKFVIQENQPLASNLRNLGHLLIFIAQVAEQRMSADGG